MNGNLNVESYEQFKLDCNLINALRPRQNGRHFPDDTFKRIFLNENIRIATKNSLTFVPKGPIINIPALVQIMAWRRPGDKPLSEPMVVSLPTHICVARPQWVNGDPVGNKLSLVQSPVWYQAITWTNDDLVDPWIYAPLFLSVLTHWPLGDATVSKV